MTEEIWVTVAGFARYEISNLANIRRRLKNGKYKTLKHRTASHGYKTVNLCTSPKDKKINKYVHRLLAEAFIPPSPGKQQVNHINGNKSDNRLENLEWSTKSENSFHGYKTGLIPSGQSHHWSRLTEDTVKKIRNSPHGYRKTAQEFGVSMSCVAAIVKRRTWKYV